MQEPPDQKKPIPREFHSEYEGRPFRACSHCGEPLSAFAHYQINKAWRNDECVFEYVFCEVCRDRMLEEFSDESKSRLMRHQEEHLRDSHGTNECAFCGRSREESPMRDFTITALCTGDGMLDSLMICDPCQMETHELLSEKTRDVRRRFLEDLPGVPPDWDGLIVEPEEVRSVAVVSGKGGVTSPFHPMAQHVVHITAAEAADGLPCLELLWCSIRSGARPANPA